MSFSKEDTSYVTGVLVMLKDSHYSDTEMGDPQLLVHTLLSIDGIRPKVLLEENRSLRFSMNSSANVGDVAAKYRQSLGTDPVWSKWALRFDSFDGNFPDRSEPEAEISQEALESTFA